MHLSLIFGDRVMYVIRWGFVVENLFLLIYVWAACNEARIWGPVIRHSAHFEKEHIWNLSHRIIPATLLKILISPIFACEFSTYLRCRCCHFEWPLSSGEETEVERQRVGVPVDDTFSHFVPGDWQRACSPAADVLSYHADSFEGPPWRLYYLSSWT